MHEKIIDFETAKLAKKKGFDEYCRLGYSARNREYVSFQGGQEKIKNSIGCYEIKGEYFVAPTKSFLQQWLRERHKIHIYLVPKKESDRWMFISLRFLNKPLDAPNSEVYLNVEQDQLVLRTSYEDALEDGLLKALNLLPDVIS